MATINGGPDKDIISGTSGDDQIDGLAGDDTIEGGDGNDQITGGSNNDETNGNDTLKGGAGDDSLDGAFGDDVLQGGDGNDVLLGNLGDDAMTGGKGDDRYDVDSTGDKITESAGQGIDTVISSLEDFTLGANFENLELNGFGGNGTGNALDNVITGNDGLNFLNGGGGNDRLIGGGGSDLLTGGAGNDSYVVTDNFDIIFEQANGGTDAIETTLDDQSLEDPDYANVENLTLIGTDDLDASGDDFNNTLTGNSGINQLSGGKGNDTLDGGTGADTLKGGTGNDTYILDSATDVVIEAVGEGKDTVLAAQNFTLGVGQEIEILTLTGDADTNAIGNGFNNTLNGNIGKNLLDGGLGDDVMAGGKGDDRYFVESAGDKVTEAAKAGFDTIVSDLSSFTLGANIEALELGGGASNGVGNSLDNTITGNVVDNTLEGAAGNDTLSGGTGKDTLVGGAGNDIYVLADIDTLVEAKSGGTDTIQTKLNNLSLAAFTNIENLALIGSADLDAGGNDFANALTGNSGKNKLEGGKDNDTLDGGTGDDTLIGGLGNDTYVVDSADDVVQEAASEGKDTLLAAVSYDLAAGQEIEFLTLTGIDDFSIRGNEIANTLKGNDGDNHLDGGAGDDAMAGGKGDDTYTVDSVGDKITEAANQGFDTVVSDLAAFTLGSNLEELALSNKGVNGTGNTAANKLFGNDLANILDGGAGDDEIDGGKGLDTLIGGAGNDTFVLNDEFDTITEAKNGGIDTIKTALNNLVLADFANVENVTLTGNANLFVNGDDFANTLTGNAGKNTLTGNKGDDILDGATEADLMFGGLGNDTYFVDNALDKTLEIAGEGKDKVIASVSFTLQAGVEIEILQLDGATDLTGTGNELDNTILGKTGNDTLNGGFGNDQLDGKDGNDTLNGGGGDDVLTGGGGNDADTLIGGAGNDSMAGGKGEDTYEVDSAGDKITELASGGFDIVRTSLLDFTLGANLENLELIGAALNGTGNTADNGLTGNALDNKLDGGAGNDLLQGGNGSDTLIGGSGNDRLEGGAGADAMSGGAGDDTYQIDDAGDAVTEAANGGRDKLRVLIGGITLGAHVEDLEIVGSGNFSAFGNALNNAMTGNADDNILTGGQGDDTLNGNGGKDTLAGGLGNDTYLVDSSDDVVDELVGEGKDMIVTAADFSLATGREIEVLTATESIFALVLTGNEFNNTITGNFNNNTLNGGDGNDTLNGGAGNDFLGGGTGSDAMAGGEGDDIYEIDNAGDKATEAANQGIDEVRSALAAITLGANLENLGLLDGGLNATGNALDNRMIGNTVANTLDGAAGNDTLDGGGGNDTLKGGAGADTLFGDDADDVLDGGVGNDTLVGGDGDDAMTGGAGNDIYEVTDAGDTITEAAGGGIDLVQTSLDGFVLGANLENLTLLDNGDISASGNALNNIIAGNDGKNALSGDKGNDTLDGGAGADALIGGTGNDTYFVDDALDTVTELTGEGKDTVISSVDFTITAGQEIETLILVGAGLEGIGNDLANTIVGGSGDDIVGGFGGNDVLTDNEGEDLLAGGEGNDVLTGGSGNDGLFGGTGNDVLIGGEGDDQFEIDSLSDKITENADEGLDLVFSTLSETTLGANLEFLVLQGAAKNGTGNALNNALAGNDGDNILSGAAGNDRLAGFGGSDTVKGGTGDDLLDGGKGADILIGDAGADGFFFFVDQQSDLNLIGGDTILDFQTGIDTVNLFDLLDAFNIDAADAFSLGHVLLTQNSGDTLVRFDADGTAGGGAAVTLATVKLSVVGVADIAFEAPPGAV